jgi:hypothetical protein
MDQQPGPQGRGRGRGRAQMIQLLLDHHANGPDPNRIEWRAHRRVPIAGAHGCTFYDTTAVVVVQPPAPNNNN